MLKAALALGLLTAVALAAIVMSIGDNPTPASAGNGGMEAMSIDADPTGNTATVLGERNDCAETEAGADVTVDITALNIPAGTPMISFNYEITYDANNLSVTAFDNDQLLGSLPNSSLFDASEPVPDTDGVFQGASLDVGDGETTAESGSGVLSSVTISVDGSAPAGGYLLTLVTNNSVHIDPDNLPHLAQSYFNAQLAVGVTCESLGPVPTPTPPPAFTNGDIDCDGDVDAVDALQLLRHVAGLGATQQAGCPGIGDQIGDAIFGDVDCDGDVDAVDALQILRHVAGLGANQQAGCAPLP